MFNFARKIIQYMESQSPKQSGAEKFIRILGMVMSFVYIVLGMGLFTKAIDLSAMNFNLEETATKVLGAGLVVYGGFRLYRAMKGGVRN